MAGKALQGKFRFDLLEVIMVNLPCKVPEGTSDIPLNGMLKTLFSPELSKQIILKRLGEIYHIPVNQQLEGGISTMCNFGEAILEQGIERGIERGIEQGMERGEQRVNHLIQLLLTQARSDEIAKAVSDKEYQQKLFEEFGL